MRVVAATLGLLAVASVTWGFFVLRAWRARRLHDAHYRAALEQSPNGMLLADAASLRILDANPAFLAAIGYSLAELRERVLTQVFVDDDLGANALAERLRDPDSRVPMLLHERSKSGALLEIEATGYRLDLDGVPLIALTANDVTLRRKVEAQLLEKQQHLDHLAHHDQLTGLPNRLYLAHHLPGAINEAKRNGTMLAVLFLDLDRFKQINDSRGHETGDKLLKQVAERVRSTVRAEDIVVRMGGDEFIVVLQSIRNTDFINEMATRI